MSQGFTKGVPVDTDATLAGNSDLVVPTQKAVRAFVYAKPQPLDTTDSPQFNAVNIGNASDTTLTRVSAGVAAIEGKNIALNGTGETLTVGTIELGHASDTTISRSEAGVIAVEGKPVVTTTGGQTVQFGAGAAATPSITTTGDTNTGLLFPAADTLAISTGGSERVRVTSGGNLLVGATATPNLGSATDTGFQAQQTGFTAVIADSTAPLALGRQTNDGNVLNIYQGGTLEGSISVSGTTVSYGSFSGSHWSQLADGSKADILPGTVVESINEKCVWPGEENDQLAKFKISDTPASRRVYGVFMAWDNDDTETNDAYITGIGAYIVRVAAGVTVQGGDLLESNGDGCARAQPDDLIRSSTIAKVTSNVVTHTYPDGSYTVPCVLYCG